MLAVFGLVPVEGVKFDATVAPEEGFQLDPTVKASGVINTLLRCNLSTKDSYILGVSLVTKLAPAGCMAFIESGKAASMFQTKTSEVEEAECEMGQDLACTVFMDWINKYSTQVRGVGQGLASIRQLSHRAFHPDGKGSRRIVKLVEAVEVLSHLQPPSMPSNKDASLAIPNIITNTRRPKRGAAPTQLSEKVMAKKSKLPAKAAAAATGKKAAAAATGKKAAAAATAKKAAAAATDKKAKAAAPTPPAAAVTGAQAAAAPKPPVAPPAQADGSKPVASTTRTADEAMMLTVDSLKRTLVSELEGMKSWCMAKVAEAHTTAQTAQAAAAQTAAMMQAAARQAAQAQAAQAQAAQAQAAAQAQRAAQRAEAQASAEVEAQSLRGQAEAHPKEQPASTQAAAQKRPWAPNSHMEPPMQMGSWVPNPQMTVEQMQPQMQMGSWAPNPQMSAMAQPVMVQHGGTGYRPAASLSRAMAVAMHHTMLDSQRQLERAESARISRLRAANDDAQASLRYLGALSNIKKFL